MPVLPRGGCSTRSVPRPGKVHALLDCMWNATLKQRTKLWELGSCLQMACEKKRTEKRGQFARQKDDSDQKSLTAAQQGQQAGDRGMT